MGGPTISKIKEPGSFRRTTLSWETVVLHIFNRWSYISKDNCHSSATPSISGIGKHSTGIGYN